MKQTNSVYYCISCYHHLHKHVSIMQVGSVNFSSKFDPNAKSPVELTKFYTNMISLVCRADVLSADADIQTQVSNTVVLIKFGQFVPEI